MFGKTLLAAATAARLGGYGVVALACWQREPRLVWGYSLVLAAEVVGILVASVHAASGKKSG